MKSENGGIHLSSKMIVAIITAVVAVIGGTNVGNYKLATGASEETTDDIRLVIETTVTDLIERDKSTMTMDEAEIWRMEQDRIDFVDAAITEYGADINELNEDIQQVQETVTINQAQNQAMHQRQNLIQETQENMMDKLEKIGEKLEVEP